MHSSTSSSKSYAPVWVFVVVFLLLPLGWESVIRARYSPSPQPAFGRLHWQPKQAGEPQRMVIVGNSLMLMGLSPKAMMETWGEEGPTRVSNIALNSQPPQAYLHVLKKMDVYPDVLVINVSSHINSANFTQEAAIIERRHTVVTDPNWQLPVGKQPNFQTRMERTLGDTLSDHMVMFKKRYHLADFVQFLGKLATSGDRDRSFYQMGLQSWFRLQDSHLDGYGYNGMNIEYRANWERGQELMVERQLTRMKYGYYLNAHYWRTLDEQIAHFQQKGTRFIMLRMPEHERIYQANNKRYDIPKHMRQLADKHDLHMLDLNQTKLAENARLYDGIHMDHAAATEVSQKLARYIQETWPALLTPAP